MHQPETSYLDMYTLFEVHAFASSKYDGVLLEFGELSALTRQIKAIKDATEQEISTRDQWGRYHIYVNNPKLFGKHRLRIV